MPTLLELQQSFAAALIAGDPRAGEFVIADGIAPDARLNIYSNTCAGNLVGALRISFPAVRKLVGDDFFEGAALVFIAAVPPKSAYLNAYGAEFPQFLAQFPPASSVPYLADVARLEWAVNRAAHADDAVPLDLGALRSLDPADLDGLTLRFEPSVALLASAWPVDAMWRANQPDADPDAVVDATTGPVALEVRRIDDDVVVRRLDAAHHAFRDALIDGDGLAAAAAAASGKDGRFDLGRALRELFDDTVLTGFRVMSRPEEIS